MNNFSNFSNQPYPYKLASNKAPKLNCPHCGAIKHWQRYIDTKTGEVLPEQYGRCDNKSKCSYSLSPYSDGYAKPIQNNEKGSRSKLPNNWKPQLSITISHCTNNTPIEFETKLFTEIKVFDPSKAGIVNHLSITDLALRLNEYKRKQGNKNQNPAILKGLYSNGTAGEFCEVMAPYLFFDIDVKENENEILIDLNNRNIVFEYLKKISVLVWLSNSQKGIAGILYTPQLVEVSNSQTEEHLTVSKKIYSYLSDLILQQTGLKIEFDFQQGKFRQVRYLAEQSEYREINRYPVQFNFAEQPQQVFFDFDTFKQTLQPEYYENNTFIQNLLTNVAFPFETSEVIKVIELYRLGTVASGYRAGAVTFPFIDINNNLRAVQVKQFDEQNHTKGTPIPLNRIIEYSHKENNKPLPEWLVAYNKNESTFSCLFAEHLLNKYPSAQVYLFEAPKTATYFTLYFGHPEKSNIICLAVNSEGAFSFDKLKVLQGRFVTVFSDLSENGNTFIEWGKKAKKFEKRLHATRFKFSDLLEQLAPQEDKSEGKDIADYLILQDWRSYRKSTPQLEAKKVTEVTKVTQQQNILFSHVEPLQEAEVFKTLRIEHHKKEQPHNWSNEIAELENYFASITLPKHPIKLNSYSTITDCSKFIEAHLIDLKVYSGNKRFTPYLSRMQELKQTLSK